MRKLKLTLVFFLIISILTITGAWAEGESNNDVKNNQPKLKTIKHVIFITVEGLNDARIRSAHTPNINGLASIGVKTKAIGVVPTNSDVFMASILTGSDPSVHGLTSSDERLKTRIFPEMTSKYGHNSVFVYPTGTISQNIFRKSGSSSDSVAVKTLEVNNHDNKQLITKAIDEFNKNKPFFLGVKLAVTDDQDMIKIGNSGDVSKAVNTVDEQIGRLFTAMRTRGIFDECLVVLMGSYGELKPESEGESYTSSQLMVPIYISGPGIKTGVVLPTVKIIDVMPTVALLTGIQISPESNGLVLWNTLNSGTGFVEENLLLKRVKELSEENAKSFYAIGRLAEEKRFVNIEKQNVNKEKTRIQNTMNEKDHTISMLNWKIRSLVLLEVITVAMMGIGYIVEYYYLRKRFLMF